MVYLYNPVPLILNCMVTNYLYNNETLFKNVNALRECFEPATFQYREHQLRELGITVSPTLQNATPRHVLLRGLPGTGKTTAIFTILRELREKTNNVIPVYVSCQDENTTGAVLRKIFTTVSQTQVPASGIPLSTLCNRLGKLLTAKNKIIVLCLDDINFFRSDQHLNDTLARLCRLHHEFPAVRIGIIVAVSDVGYDIKNALDASTRSIFQHHEIYFPPYSEDKMNTILSERAEAAFHPGVISQEMIREITAVAFNCSDLRVGMKLLDDSSTHAAISGRTSIETQDVQAVLTEAKNVRFYNLTRTLLTPEREILFTIAVMYRETDTPGQSASEPEILTTTVIYRAINEDKPKKANYSTFNSHIRHLESLRLIDTSKQNLPTHGRITEVMPRYEAGVVKEACRRTSRRP